MRKLIFLSTFLIILFIPDALRAQDSVEVVVLSQRVGPLIDPLKADYFRIFSNYKSFTLAYFTRDSADAYSMHIYFKNEDRLQVKNIPVMKITLLNYGEKIDNFEKLNTGSYIQGSNPAELKFIWISKEEIKKILGSKNKTNYFLVKEQDNDYKKFLQRRSWFSFSAGISLTNFNFDELNTLTDKIYNYYKSNGYTVSSLRTDYRMGPIYRFRGVFDIISNLSASVMVDGNFKNQSIKYDAVTFMGLYNFTNLSETFVPYAALGYTRNNFSITIQYNNAIIDSWEGRLQSITIDGGTEGIIIEAGIKIILSDYFNFGIAADYYFLSAYNYENEFPVIGSEIKPGNIGADAGIIIKF